MRIRRWLVAVLAVVVVMGPMSVRAQTNNVVVIDGGDSQEPIELPAVLEEGEIIRIAQLQNYTQWLIASPVSPDDSKVVVFNSDGDFGVVDVRDGSSRMVSLEQLGPIVPLIFLAPFGGEGFQWVNERVIATIAVNLAAESIEDVFGVVYIDVLTNEVAGVGLGLDENSVPYALAPGGERVLVLTTELAPNEGGVLRVPTRVPAPLASLRKPLVTAEQVAAVLRKAPQLEPFLIETRGYAQYRALQVLLTTTRLSVIDLVEGSVSEVASFPAGTVPGIAGWRGDGEQFALSVFGQFDAGQTRNQGRARLDGALISEQGYRDVTGNLPPSINPMLQGNALHVFDLVNGTSNSVRAADSGGVMFFQPTWSPDNSTLLVKMLHPAKLSDRTYPSYSLGSSSRSSYRFYNSDLEPLGSFEALAVSSPFSARGVFVSPDEVVFESTVGVEQHPYYYNRVSGEFRDIADRAGSFSQIVATRQSRQLVFVHSSFSSPPDLYRAGWNGAGLARLTWANEELRLSSQTREYPVSFTLSNGQRRSGALILPADVPYPPKNTRIVVWQEGGPGPAMINQWLTNVENPYALLPNFGFGLLVVPLSGRPGYGPAVLDALSDRNNFGQIDIGEQSEIVRQMISRGWTSSPKLGITGCSYGGYFAWQSIANYPDLYAAANPQCALVDLPVEWARGYGEALPALEGRPPWVQPTEYTRDSPSYNVAKVRAAVLTFHGTEDFLPITQNENMHLQLVNAGRAARMLKFEGAGHGLGRADYQLYAAQEQVQWFRTYLR